MSMATTKATKVGTAAVQATPVDTGKGPDGKEKANRWENKEVGITREGKAIILPGEPFKMRYSEAILALKRAEQEEEMEISVSEEVDAFPYDGAHAFMLAMKQTYGWVSSEIQVIQTFFGPMEIPPKTINVETDFGKNIQVLWGAFAIPGMDGQLVTGWATKNERPIFRITGKIKKKHQAEVGALAELTRYFAKEQSIYKGKAIALKTDEDGDLEMDTPPRFLDLSRVNPDELTFSESTAEQVEVNLFTPIEYTEACRANKIPLKRGILLEGPFGTGKTLTAFVAATKARANGWTFVMVDRVAGLDDALKFARMYQPAVVFAEDIDREVAGQERTEEIDDILNTIDGLESKGTEVITVLTSNDVAGINRAMLRPGRLDCIISVQAPDAKAVDKLVRIYARDLVQKDEDLSEAALELEGQIPATIREVVERSKLYAIGRTGGREFTLTGADLAKSARGMKHHLGLMRPKLTVEPSVPEKLGLAFSAVVAEGVKGNGLYGLAAETNKNMNRLAEKVGL